MGRGQNASSYVRSDLQDIELREEMLEGRWVYSLWNEMERQLGKQRMEINGIADVSQNPLLDKVVARAVCYSPPPLVTGLDPSMASIIGDNSGFGLKIDYASLVGDLITIYPDIAAQIEIDSMSAPMPSDLSWLLGMAQRYWLATNDAGIFVNYADGQLVKQRIRASAMRGQGDPQDPGTPILLGWNRPVTVDGRYEPDSWDIWDTRNPSSPSYKILRGPKWNEDGSYDGGEDITAKVLDGETAREGENYTWRWTQGRRAGLPFIPVKVYHKHYPESLFDRSSGSEDTQGTLTAGVLNSFWLHVCRDASWPDRNVRGLNLVGAAAEDHDEPRSLPNDPAAIKVWDDDNPEKPGQFHQWEPGADPEKLGKAIRSYRQMLDEQSVPADITNVPGDPLQHMVQSLQREVERLYPICRKYDSALLEMIAATINTGTAADPDEQTTDFPESGYGLLYRTEIDKIRTMIDNRQGAPT